MNRTERRAAERLTHKLEARAGGPVTEAGKAISSRNALKHGSCSMATLILPNESREDFDALETRWFNAYKPTTDFEAELIRHAIRAEWFFERADRNYAELEATMYASNPDVFTWCQMDHDRQRLFLRYRTTQANLLAKARKAIEDYRKARTRELAEQQTARIKEEKHAIHKQNHPSELSWQDEIEALKRQAISLGYLTPDGKPTGKTL